MHIPCHEGRPTRVGEPQTGSERIVIYTHYDYLEIAPGAPRERVEAAYARVLERFNHGMAPSGQDLSGLVRMIHSAYQVLSNPSSREAYDAQLRRDAEAGRRRAQGRARPQDGDAAALGAGSPRAAPRSARAARSLTMPRPRRRAMNPAPFPVCGRRESSFLPDCKQRCGRRPFFFAHTVARCGARRGTRRANARACRSARRGTTARVPAACAARVARPRVLRSPASASCT